MPLPVILLCHADGTNGSTTFTDVSPGAHTLTPTSATVSTASPKFGTGSADFTASNLAHIDTGTSVDFRLGAGQFTVEAWAYFTAATGSGVFSIVQQWLDPSQIGWFLGIVNGALGFYYSTNGTVVSSVSIAYTPTLNTWIHVAADRDSAGVVRIYANGTPLNSATVASAIFASTQNCSIGGNLSNSYTWGFAGRLDEVRVVNGAAMYGGAFTPAAAPFVISTNTTWNPIDKTAGTSLPGGLLLTASMTGGGAQGVRATDGQNAGKMYFEITATTWTGTGGHVGIANTLASLGNLANANNNAAGVLANGLIYVNNSYSGNALSGIANGNIFGFAIDLDNKLLWIRIAPAGNWNGNAGHSPGGVGGMNIAAIVSTGLYPVVSVPISPTGTFVANFGDSTFSGAVPSGYTAGWPIVAQSAAASAQARAMVLA